MRNCESEEMYLETILILSREKGQVRRVDIAESMNVSKPSVTFAIRSLTEKGYVCDDGNGGILQKHTDAARACIFRLYENPLMQENRTASEGFCLLPFFSGAIHVKKGLNDCIKGKRRRSCGCLPLSEAYRRRADPFRPSQPSYQRSGRR